MGIGMDFRTQLQYQWKQSQRSINKTTWNWNSSTQKGNSLYKNTKLRKGYVCFVQATIQEKGMEVALESHVLVSVNPVVTLTHDINSIIK